MQHSSAVFTLTCRSCGNPIEIPGRFGFKLKNAGLSTTLCSSCRQAGFLKTREEGINHIQTTGDSPAQRRVLPGLVLVATAALLIGGLWLQKNGNPFTQGQDPLPTSASPSR